MRYKGYILNLSGIYNARQFLYLYHPVISSGKLRLFEEITAVELSANTEKQRAEIDQKIRELKEDLDLFRLKPGNDPGVKWRINIVFDLLPWEFTGYEEYSFLPFVKVSYIRERLEYFLGPSLRDINLQYFLLKEKENKKQNYAYFLDFKQGLKERFHGRGTDFGEMDSHTLAWPEWEPLTLKLDKGLKAIFSTRKQTPDAKDPLNERDRLGFDKMFEELWDEVRRGFGCAEKPQMRELLEAHIRETQRQIKNRIVRNDDLNKELLIDFLKKFFKKFSCSTYLRNTEQNKDLLFRFGIAHAGSSRIGSFEELTLFLIESISFFNQDQPLKFLTGNRDRQIIQIQKIAVDREQLNNLFGRYLELNEVKSKKPALQQKIQLIKIREDASPILYKLNEEDKKEFLRLDSIRKELSLFYSVSKARRLGKLLDEYSIDGLENKIDGLEKPAADTAYMANEWFDPDSNTGVIVTDDRQKIETEGEIKSALNRLREEERGSVVLASVNFENYSKEKELYKENLKVLKEEFLTSLFILPERQKVYLYSGLVIVLVLLLAMPLYTFSLWKSAFVAGGVTFVFLLLLNLALLSIYKKRVNEKFTRLQQANERICRKLEDYVKQLEELMKEIRISSVRRRNISTLEQALAKADRTKLKLLEYKGFYEGLLEQIRMNGHKIERPEEMSMVREPEYSTPPVYDKRIKTSGPGKKIKITPDTAEGEEREVNAETGLIKEIQFKIGII